MSKECDICGEEFDSERGLHEHQTKVHSEENEQKTRQNDNSSNVVLGIKQFGAATFAFGLLLGLIGGGVGGELLPQQQNSVTAQPSVEPTDSGPQRNQGPNQGQDKGPNQEQNQEIDMGKIEMKGEPVLGQEDAPVTMVVYEDFECPFCKRFEENAVPEIKKNYIDSGKVKMVWKDRPLTNIHKWAKPAAEAMECVYREGGGSAFWTLKNKVFANQDSLSVDNAQSKVKSWAAEEGVSESAVQSCIDSGDAMKEVEADSTEGKELGASGTPTTYINGQKVTGAQPFSNFERIIDTKLSKINN